MKLELGIPNFSPFEESFVEEIIMKTHLGRRRRWGKFQTRFGSGQKIGFQLRFGFFKSTLVENFVST